MIQCTFIRQWNFTKGDHPVVFDIKFCHFCELGCLLQGKWVAAEQFHFTANFWTVPGSVTSLPFVWCCSSVRTVTRWCSCCWRRRQISRIWPMMTHRYSGLVCLSVSVLGDEAHVIFIIQHYSLLSSRLTVHTSHVILNEWLSFCSMYF